MIDVIKQQFKPDMSTASKLNVTREFLQILCLKIMSEKKMFDHCAFLGGTSLRILFNLKRFSEDLDFSLIKNAGYDFNAMNNQLVKSFALYGLTLEAKIKSEGTVHNSLLKFAGLLKDLGLSQLPDQKFSIKLEVDTNPPVGWHITNTIVNKMSVFNIVHYDLPSLYAGKLHACFFRKFTKGRDFYDFVWYMSRKVKPNLILLNNAIKQTQGKDLAINEENFKEFLLNGIQPIDFEFVKKDVERFLEDKSELNVFDQKIIADTIKSTY